MLRTLKLALIIGALVLAPLALRADSMSEDLSLSIPSTTLTVGIETFSVTPFAQFNPAYGTLNSFTVTLAGSVNWSTTVPAPEAGIDMYLSFPGASNNLIASPDFTTPGIIKINLSSGTVTYGPYLSDLTGMGNTMLDFIVAADDGDIISTVTPGLSGTITYNYTPAPTPECCSFLLFGTGLIGLVLAVRKRSRHAPPGWLGSIHARV